MKIIYFADGPWAHLAFDRIVEQGIKISLMVLRYETKDPVLQAKAKEHNIECTWTKNVNDSDFRNLLESTGTKLAVSMSFNQIFKRDLIDIFPLGLINCHAGKLPLFRGRNVLNWALINGEKEIGVTCHYVDEGVDSGDIISQKTFPILMEDDYGSILEKAYNQCADVLIHSINLIKKGNVESKPQPQTGTYFIGRKNGDEFINWNWDSERIYNFVRAITVPGPCARTWIEFDNNYHLVIIEKVSLIPDAISHISVCGGINGKSAKGNPIVKTGDTSIEILEYEIVHPKKTNLRIGDRLGVNHNLMMLWNKN